MNLDRHIAAGYLLLKPVPRPEWVSSELMPAQLVSASSCLCPRFPGTYAISWCNDSADHRAFDEIGLAPSGREDAIQWATAEFDKSFGWPAVFLTLEAALAARERFFPMGDLVVIGLGLPARFRERFIVEATPPPPAEGFAPIGKSGLLEAVEMNETLMQGGNILGYEPLTAERGQIGCSWLCNSLERHIAETTTIRPSPTGFVESLPDAIHCCEVFEDPDLGAEPGPWFPWLITRYDRPTFPGA